MKLKLKALILAIALAVTGLCTSRAQAQALHPLTPPAGNGDSYALFKSGPLGKIYGFVRQGYATVSIDSTLSFTAGRLPMLLGAKNNAPTLENINIERGLLWNQENIANSGVQANYANGPLALSLFFSQNDRFFSSHFNWASGSAAYALDSTNTLGLVAGKTLAQSSHPSFPALPEQNGGSIYNLIYAHTSGPWTIMPYLQHAYMPKTDLMDAESTYGAAMLARYSLRSGFSLAGRAEYIFSGGNAWSMGIAPAYQREKLFVRLNALYLQSTSARASHPRLTLQLGMLL